VTVRERLVRGMENASGAELPRRTAANNLRVVLWYDANDHIGLFQ
jgi:hypothetical protein